MSEKIDITPEQIAAWQEQQRALEKQRLHECNARLVALLREYNCDLVATPRIADGAIVADIQIVSKGNGANSTS